MTDHYANLASSLESPAGGAFAILPSDSEPLSIATRALYVGARGNLTVEMVWGGTVTFVGVPEGAMLALRVSKVRSTGTTAGSIVGVY